MPQVQNRTVRQRAGETTAQDLPGRDEQAAGVVNAADDFLAEVDELLGEEEEQVQPEGLCHCGYAVCLWDVFK